MSPIEIRQRLKTETFGYFKELYNKHKNIFNNVSKPKYNKIPLLIQTILRSRSSRLSNMSEVLIQKSCFKTNVNKFSYFFTGGKEKLEKRKRFYYAFKEFNKEIISEMLTDIKDRVIRYNGKILTAMDWTAYAKKARKNRCGKGMQFVGKVYDGRKGKYVTGYGGLLAGCVLEDDNFFFTDHKLYSNIVVDEMLEGHHSMTEIEQEMIDRMIKRFGKEIIIMADRHFPSKGTLYYIKKQDVEFLMRIKANVNIEDGYGTQTILKRAKLEKEKFRVFWYQDKGKKKIPCEALILNDVKLRKSDKKEFSVNIIIARPEANDNCDPLILVTSLAVNKDNLQIVMSQYKFRWNIETGIKYLKESFDLEKFMVRKWIGIDIMTDLIIQAYLIYMISFFSLKEFRWLLDLAKKITAIKNHRVSFGKFCFVVFKIFPPPRLPTYIWKQVCL